MVNIILDQWSTELGLKFTWSTDLFVDVSTGLGTAASASDDSPLTVGALQQRHSWRLRTRVVLVVEQ